MVPWAVLPLMDFLFETLGALVDGQQELTAVKLAS